MDEKVDQLVLTFDELLRRTPLASRLKNAVRLLEEHYHSPVDTEFVAKVIDPQSSHPDVEISLLQCRPQSHLKEISVPVPKNLAPEDIVFATSRMAPRGSIQGVRYVLFITPEGYFNLPTKALRVALGRALGQLNAALAHEVFICVGPGRWGTTNPDLGVNIGFGDIYNTRALVELSGQGIGSAPEASFGTHFFQDLVESNIYPIAIYLDDEEAAFNRDFFYHTPNLSSNYLSEDTAYIECLRLIEVSSYRPGHRLDIVMDDEKGRTVAYLVPK